LLMAVCQCIANALENSWSRNYQQEGGCSNEGEPNMEAHETIYPHKHSLGQEQSRSSNAYARELPFTKYRGYNAPSSAIGET
jgi:hypothetical protein